MFKVNPRVFGVAKSASGKKSFVTSDVTATMPGERQSTPSSKPSNVGAIGYRSNMESAGSDQLTRPAAEAKKPVKKEPFTIGGNTIRRPSGSSIETSSAETADFVPGGGMDTSTNIETQSYYQDVLSGFIDTYIGKNAGTTVGLNKIYRDIYLSDSVCGNAVEIMSNLPWSDFEITGVKDSKKLQLFVDSCDRMRITTLLPSASIEYMVNGAFCGSLTFDKEAKIFTAITPQNLDFVDLLQVPMFGIDPLITLRVPQEIAEFLKSDDTRAREFDKLIPDDLLSAKEKIAGNNKDGSLAIPLSADRTIFIPRKGMLKDFRGTSMFRRVLVPWLVEKALMRGTLDQVWKRQRAISHVTAGDEEWKPSNEELEAIANLFLNADLDPVGSIVVTRNGISVNEVREGGNFWRWDQSAADLATIKLKAIGVSEAFVTGEFTASTMDAALSTFMENQRNHRETFTREFFYEKTFPLISKENDITIRRYGTKLGETANFEPMANQPGSKLIMQHGNTRMYRTYEGDLVAEIAAGSSNSPHLTDISQYIIPEVQWQKRLMPEYDSAYLEIINTLKENGVPIPIRLLAAVGGMNMQNLLDSKDDDLKIRTLLGEWVKEINDINKESGLVPDEEGGEGGGEFASFIQGKQMLRPRGLLSRSNERIDPDSPLLLPPNFDSQGRRRVQTTQMKVDARSTVDRMMARAAVEVAKRENAKPENYNRKKSYSHSPAKKD